MAYLGAIGDTSEVSTDEMNQKRGYRPLPAGWYRAALSKDDAKPADWGTGLSLEFSILSGEYEGQKIFDFLCVEHRKSEKAQHIARVKLRELATAAGHKTPEHVEDTDSLYGRPIMIEVYRATDETKYAEEDGKKARIGQFLSVAAWKAEHGGTPALATPAAAKSKPATRPAPTPEDDDTIPF